MELFIPNGNNRLAVQENLTRTEKYWERTSYSDKLTRIAFNKNSESTYTHVYTNYTQVEDRL